MSRVRREWRMVNRKQDGALAGLAIRFQPSQLTLQKSELVIYQREMAFLRGNNTCAAVQHIAVQPNNRDERSIEREVNPRLGHDAAY